MLRVDHKNHDDDDYVDDNTDDEEDEAGNPRNIDDDECGENITNDDKEGNSKDIDDDGSTGYLPPRACLCRRYSATIACCLYFLLPKACGIP